MTDPRPDAPDDDAAARALVTLVGRLEECQVQLAHARNRAERLLAARRSGRPWLDIVSTESRPLVVETISAVLASLATAGHAWRRQQALALRAEGVSINRVAALFGVTRQRISALVREGDGVTPPAAPVTAGLAAPQDAPADGRTPAPPT